MSSDGSLLSADDSRARGLGAGRSHFPSMEAMDLRDSIRENEYLEWSVKEMKRNRSLRNYLEEMRKKKQKTKKNKGNGPDTVVRGEPALTLSHFGVTNKLDNSWDP
jgi:hypothetical protein